MYVLFGRRQQPLTKNGVTSKWSNTRHTDQELGSTNKHINFCLSVDMLIHVVQSVTTEDQLHNPLQDISVFELPSTAPEISPGFSAITNVPFTH